MTNTSQNILNPKANFLQNILDKGEKDAPSLLVTLEAMKQSALAVRLDDGWKADAFTHSPKPALELPAAYFSSALNSLAQTLFIAATTDYKYVSVLVQAKSDLGKAATAWQIAADPKADCTYIDALPEKIETAMKRSLVAQQIAEEPALQYA